MKDACHLFVYGTLGPGKPNEHVLCEMEGIYHQASVYGRLVDAGWGSAMGYPGLVLDDEGEQVQGYVYISQVLEEHLERLDAFEGSGYQRTTTKATLIDGSHVDVYVYVICEGNE